MAHHASAGGLWVEGLSWSRRAAALAAQLFAHGEASQLLEQALRCSSQVGPEQERLEREIDLRVQIARMGEFYHRPGRMVQWLAPAHRAAKALGDPTRLTAVNLTRAESWLTAGRTALGIAAVKALLPTLQGDESRIRRHQTLFLLGSTYGMQGRLKLAIPALVEAHGLVSDTDDHALRLLTQSTLSGAHLTIGEFASAEALLQETLREAIRRKLGPNMANAYCWLAVLELVRGRWSTAQTLAETGMQTAAQAEHPWQQYCCSQYLPLALIQQGQLKRAFTVIEQSFALARQMGTTVLLDHLWASQAIAHLAVGDAAAALDATGQGIRIARQLGSIYGLALNQLYEAQALHLKGERYEAHALFLTTLAELTEHGVLPLAAQCHAGLGAVLGDRPEATYHLQQAAALQARLGLVLA